MKVNINKVLETIDGIKMKDSDGQGNAIDATVKLALINAVLAAEQKDTPVQKLEKGELARKIYKAEGEVDLTAEEITLCKKRVGEVFPNPLIVLQLTEILEGKVQ
jgi:hypothetical protein